MLPRKKPAINDDQKKIIFFVKKNKIISENPTDASPETNEQFVRQDSEYLNHSVKRPSPPK